MNSRFLPGLLLLLAPPTARADVDGATLFNLNCAACHLPDQGLVGPSLAEIRTLYLDKPDDFVKWAIAPGKKRPGAVDMPSMVHVGESGLRAIHAHVMAISKGLKEKKVDKGDPFAQSPTQAARPQIQRIFLPNAGPAAIAIALDDKISLCWDAGECRFRYAWTGGFIEGYPYWKGNGSSVAAIKGKVRYTEAGPLFKGETAFHGYEVKNGLPVFHYSIAGADVTESFSPLPDGKGFQRRLKTSICPVLPAAAEGARVTLNLDAAPEYVLTYTFE